MEQCVGHLEYYSTKVKRRELYVSVVGIPKNSRTTMWAIIDRSFGFQTAVEMARKRSVQPHVEANDFTWKEREASSNFLERRLKRSGHAVVVVAGGGGQDMIPRTESQRRKETSQIIYTAPLLAHGCNSRDVMARVHGFVCGPVNGTMRIFQ
nr:ATP-dependent 6-phosphofructokinase 2 [Ipomoea batatas]